MNEYLFYAINSIVGKSLWLDEVIVFFATTFGYLLFAGLVFFLFRHRDVRVGVRDATVILSAASVAWGIALALKLLFSDPRPFLALQDITPLIQISALDGSGAFPSGHATFFASIAGSLYLYHKHIALWFGFAALLIGLSRVAAGVHWPGDILGGYVLGLVVGFGVYALYHTKGGLISGASKVE